MSNYRKFFEGSSEYDSLEELAKLLTDSSIRVLWKHAETLMFKKGGEKGIYGKTIFYIFYQDIKEELQQELGDFKNNLEIAKQVSTDERYYTLKNQKQRELFLLSEYFLSKTMAQDVIELLKPEIAKIISDSEKDAEEDVKGVILVENTKKVTKVKSGESIEVIEELSEEKLENKVVEPYPDIDNEINKYSTYFRGFT